MGYGETGTIKPEGLPGAEGAGFGLGDVVKYAKLAQQVAGILGSDEADQRASSLVPVRGKGQSDEEYGAEVSDWAADYLDLNVNEMKKRGIAPGTPEYMNFILQQADSIIEQIFSKNPEALAGDSVEGLQAALRDMTTREQQQLQRALMVRGELGKMQGSGYAFDPFTGRSERVEAVEPGGMLQGAKSAYQRGIARSTEELAGLRGQEARGYLSALTGRKADLYGMQAEQDAEALRAQLEEADAEERKRRGGSEEPKGQQDWLQRFAQEGNIDQLFSGIGQEQRGQAALLQAIFGE
jgi:hypothetical protein